MLQCPNMPPRKPRRLHRTDPQTMRACGNAREGLGLLTIPRQPRQQEKYLSEVCGDYPLHKIGDLL